MPYAHNLGYVKGLETGTKPGLSLARHTTGQVSRLPGIHAGAEP